MIGKLLGALIGAEIGKQRREGGASGAVKGVIAASVLRRMGPLGLALGGAYAAKKMYDRRRTERTTV